MADQENLTSFSLRRFGRGDFNGQFININFISMRFYSFQPHPTFPSRFTILTFAVTAMLTLLEIKYQGKTESPFETHPNTMLAAVTSVILYCFLYDANLRISSSIKNSSSNSYACVVVRISMAFFGPLSLASLSSLLFPERLCPVLFSVPVLFSLCELPCSMFRLLWNLVQQVTRVSLPPELHRQGRRGGRRGRRRLPASVFIPRLSEYDREFPEQVDVLPV